MGGAARSCRNEGPRAARGRRPACGVRRVTRDPRVFDQQTPACIFVCVQGSCSCTVVRSPGRHSNATDTVHRAVQ